MKTTVIHLEGIESVLSPTGVEKHLCKHPGIHKVETNFMTGTATVYHDESVPLADIKRYVAECGYGCSGECLPEHVCKPSDPPATAAAMSHAGHTMPAAPPATEGHAHAGHAIPAVTPAPKVDVHASHQTPALHAARQRGASVPAAKMGEHASHATPEVVSGAGVPAKPAKVDEHAGHDVAAMSAESGEMAAMAHEMGHGGSMSMEGMVRDMRNRFLVTFIPAKWRM